MRETTRLLALKVFRVMSEREYLSLSEIIQRSGVSEGSVRLMLVGFAHLVDWKTEVLTSSYQKGNGAYEKQRKVYAYRLKPRAIAVLGNPQRAENPVRRETREGSV